MQDLVAGLPVYRDTAAGGWTVHFWGLLIYSWSVTLKISLLCHVSQRQVEE